MKKTQLLSKMFIFGLLTLAVTALSSSTLVWAKEKKPVPVELNGTEWAVTMVYVTSKGKKDSSEDKLVFSDKKFISDGFDSKGYDPTNYSLTLDEDGTTRFGTMQIKGKETSFWKGKVKGEKIDGSVHTQLSNSTTKTTYFTGTLASGELKPKVKTKPKFPKPTPPPAPVAPPAETAPVIPDQAVEELPSK